MLDHLPVLVLSAVLAWAYVRGARRVSSRTGRQHRWHAVAFAAGLSALVLVLVTPLEHMAEERLWAHMVQHMVLVVVAAPLLVVANPLPALLWSLPGQTRQSVMPWWRRVSRSHARPEGWVAWTVAALAVHTIAMWVWHAPDPYQAALRSESLHLIQHTSFLASALFFWWAVLGARRRSMYGAGVLAIFAAALQGTALGAYMTFSGRVWYPVYAHGGGRMTPLEDQQVAGVIMWGPAGAAYLLAAMLLLAAWLGGNERLTSASYRA